jgi:GT2 family glycosyltransferase
MPMITTDFAALPPGNIEPVAKRVTVVVLTYNRADEVCETLSRLTALPEQPPIVVVDNASTDGTAHRIARAFPHVTVLHARRNMGAAGRNLGVACAETDYVAFCDDDTWWEAGSLTHAVSVLDAHPRVAALVARIVVEPEGSEDPTSTLMRASPLDATGLPGPALLGFMAGASVFRTRAFRQTGGYEPRLFIGGEEELVTLDLVTQGWAIVYADALTVHHKPSMVRDTGRRRQLVARNALWVAWMRLPRDVAWRRTRQALHAMKANQTLLRDGLDALRGLPWALRHRREVPPRVEAMRRLLHKE